MAHKRKAAADAQRHSKRLHKSDSDNIDNGHLSDSESLSSYCLSQDDQQETPVTPFSPASSKYPSDRKTHLCPYEGCLKAFNRPARLAEHLRSHTNERIFSCTHEDCDKTFLRASHLNHHVKSAHTTIRDYVCDREGCGKTFVTGSRLRRHLAAHEGRDKYRCTEYPPCNETFRKHSTLQKHIMTAHLNQKPFPCPHTDPVTGQQCTQAFDTAGHLRAHEGRLHGGARFACTECTPPHNNTDTPAPAPAVFPTYALLQAHMKSIHPPTCAQCHQICSTSRELRRHLEITHGTVPIEERKVHPCHYPHCNRHFTKRGNLNVHIKTVHEGEKRFVCGETDLSGSKKVEGWDMIKHENGTGTGTGGCGKRYGSKLALEEHVRTAHLGLQNAKAERRALLRSTTQSTQSTTQSNLKPDPTSSSSLTLLTGAGYAEESGRHIPCLLESCAHRFHRDYDLWLHMAGKQGHGHGLEENDVQILFMQRAMQGGEGSFEVDFGAFGYPYGYGYEGEMQMEMGGLYGNGDGQLLGLGGGDGNDNVNNDDDDDDGNELAMAEYIDPDATCGEADMALIDPGLAFAEG
ncbi:Strongly-conserved Zn-finger binding protein (TFIIIA) [Onygenales sp. PD_40]|nr:Strongly-conserved Zn-finger binding protein (TFIIIA) [Onygenales sp. PD_40]KAK2776428.1 Strongly-conserved Zn-finger binding protein (TFIIIA) [Onygenales sp. PD_12]